MNECCVILIPGQEPDAMRHLLAVVTQEVTLDIQAASLAEVASFAQLLGEVAQNETLAVRACQVTL